MTSATKSPFGLRPWGAIRPTVVIVGHYDAAFARLGGALETHAVNVTYCRPKHFLDWLDRSPSDRSSRRPMRLRERTASESRLAVGAADLYLFNLITEPGEFDWRAVVRQLNACEPKAGIVLAFDTPAGETVEDALAAGADDLLWEAELGAVPIVWKRLRELLRRPEHGAVATTSASSESHSVTAEPVAEPEIARRSNDVSDAAKREALERVERGIVALPTAAARRAPLADVLGITVPKLRALSGRLDAAKIAARIDVPVSRLASIADVSRQALSKSPDSPGVQASLDPIARILDVLGTVMSAADEKKWLRASHPRLDGKTPLDVILEGGAERVARMLELATGGSVD